jgi:hypothetical protein
VGKDAAFDCYVVFDALAEQPGQVDGGVYADGFKGCAGVAGGWEF